MVRSALASGRALVALALALLLLGACSDSTSPPGPDTRAADQSVDAQRPDGATDIRDAAARDAIDAADAGGGDGATPPLAGWGTLSGACDVLDATEWNASTPFTFRNAIDFGTVEFDVNTDKSQLSSDGQRVVAEGNLNQSSLLSEVFAFEMLHRCELAHLLKTESKVSYIDPNGKKTDLLLQIDGRKIGVSVTRAVHFPQGQPLTAAEATTLLQKKLGDIPLAEQNAQTTDAWSRSILAILAFDPQHANAIAAAYQTLDAATKAKTIVFITVTNGADLFMY